tara:strand:+ start:169 stop:984 length:816 start_codon:yes stop_codon:yes gene_type:complete
MNKYIIYQGSGGLIHLLGGLVYCCEYVYKNRQYNLIIDIKNHEAFKNYFKTYFDLNLINYSENYSDIQNINHYRRIPLDEFNKRNVEYIENKGYIFEYENKIVNIGLSLEKNKNDNIIFYAGNGGNSRNLILKYIKCNTYIKNILKSKYKLSQNYIAVHFRNTDRNNDINIFINEIKKYKDYLIYIATDDIKAIDIFKKNLIDYNILYYNKPFDANGKNIHFNNPDKDNVIMSVLIDMFMMYNSNIFIPSENSLVSRLVLYMRKNNKSIFD